MSRVQASEMAEGTDVSGRLPPLRLMVDAAALHLMREPPAWACRSANLFAAKGGRAMLVELSVMAQRYHAVMEVISGASGTEVAHRYGATWQAVHSWLA
jgi:hypothetical protein